MVGGAPIPDRVIVARLQAIDKDLSVAWVPDVGTDPVGRWAVYHDLQVENAEKAATMLADELQRTYREGGYVLSREECEARAWQQVQDQKLVCYVSGDKGEFRPLDERIVEKFQRMDHYRRNCGLKDWRMMLESMAYIRQRQREKESADIWDYIRRDKTFARMASDHLWGLDPARSVIVPEQIGA